MRGGYKFRRACMTPEEAITLHSFVAPTGGVPETIDGLWIDGVPNNDYNVLFFAGAPGTYYISINDGATNVFGTNVLTVGVDYNDLVMITMVGSGKCTLDHVKVPGAAVTYTTGIATKGSGGALRQVCTRVLWNFNGAHDNWTFQNDSSVYLYDFNIVGNSDNQSGYYKMYYGRIEVAPTGYVVIFYNDATRTVGDEFGFTYLPIPLGTLLEYGQYHDNIPLYQFVGPLFEIVGYVSVNIPSPPASDYDFETFKSTWIVDSQTPSTPNWVDVTNDIKGQFRIMSGESEGVINKDVSRKVSMTLNNKENQYDYRVMNPVFNPTHLPDHWFNGPRDERLYDQTGGASGNGKEIGNIRSGRFIVVQVGAYDHYSSSYIWIDKFRGRIGDISYSRADNSVQLSIDDERVWFRQIKTEDDYYINKTFEFIFRDQAENRLKIYDVVVPTTNVKIPFLYMPDFGDTVWDALVKLAEIVLGKIELTEDGKLEVFSRLFEGDKTYTWDNQDGEDDARTLAESSIDDARETLSSSVLYNQKIINKCVISAKPFKIEQTYSKVWKWKAFYNEELGKNTGWLKPGRYFGDVWFNNTISDSQVGPVKSIDRNSTFNTGVQNIHNESFDLIVNSVPSNIINISITRLKDGTTYSGNVTADGTTEFEMSAVHPAASNVFIVMEDYLDLTFNDSSEIQLGVSYYADYSDKFRLLPNETGMIPAGGNMRFSIVSSIYDPVTPSNNWTDEKEAGSIAGNNFSDRVIMAYDPSGPMVDRNTDNIFFYNSFGGAALTKIPILFFNADSVNRYVNSIEIFGRRIVEQNNIVVNSNARQVIKTAFGGEQTLELNNLAIPNTGHAQYMGNFIVDNYAASRDIPQFVLKQPRPFYQLGDRVRSIDDFASVIREYVVMSMDEVFAVDSLGITIRTRLADHTSGPFDISTTNAEVEIVNQTDYAKLAETADVNRGASATEVRRDIYIMHGMTWDNRVFDFTTGLYSGGGGAPATGGGVVSEAFHGELREFEEPPTVLIFPVYANRKIGGAAAISTPGIRSYSINVTITGFQVVCTVYGTRGLNPHWCTWIAFGRTKRYIG